MNKQQQMIDLLQDKAFADHLGQLGTPEEVLAAFAGRGLDVTMEELKDLFAAAMAANGDELSDEELGVIAGGWWGCLLNQYQVLLPVVREMLKKNALTNNEINPAIF